MCALVGVVGHGVSGRVTGILIDNRNKMSLSRLQMLAWTILVLSAVFVAAVSNLGLGPVGTALSIAIPTEILVVMGISATSLVGAPLILSTKTTQSPDQDQVNLTRGLLAKRSPKLKPGGTAQLPEVMIPRGLVMTYNSPEYASIADLFLGEETGNAAQTDLGKVQVFYITLILLVAYAAALGALFISSTSTIIAFPAFGATLVVLLTISHAGYLANKAISHSQTQPDAQAQISSPLSANAGADNADGHATPFVYDSFASLHDEIEQLSTSIGIMQSRLDRLNDNIVAREAPTSPEPPTPGAASASVDPETPSPAPVRTGAVTGSAPSEPT
jgi:hypothetical protein